MSSQRGSKSTFDFDLGVGSNRGKSLNEQRNPVSSSYTSYSYSSTTQSNSSWQQSKPSWTHQPAPNQTSRPAGLDGPSSMVGDITGKSWNSTGSGSGIGIPEKNPSLFGDLLNSAIGRGKVSSNIPLKNVGKASSMQPSNKSSFSMGNMADSLPNNGSKPANNSSNWGPNSNVGGYTLNANKTANLGGGPSMRSAGGGTSSNKDPFGSLVDFGSGVKSNKAVDAGDEPFGGFQNASKPSSTTTTFSTSSFTETSNDFPVPNSSTGSIFGDFGNRSKEFMSRTQPPLQSASDDPLNMFFSSTTTSTAQPASEVHDFGWDTEFGGSEINDAGGSTVELEGLPPPPAGVTASSAKTKGIDNQKQGQYADAIKWLSWAVILCDKTGDKDGIVEVLSTRASCYKEVGEYKKAVADCSKVLEQNNGNISVLVQRALLYESMEKYKLGAEDLRTVLKIDPGNRIARSTVHRLAKMAE